MSKADVGSKDSTKIGLKEKYQIMPWEVQVEDAVSSIRKGPSYIFMKLGLIIALGSSSEISLSLSSSSFTNRM